jgi:predicted Zn-dependent peptidase
VSAHINGYSSRDYSGVTMNCIKGDFETVWPLYVDAITAPRFDAKEFARMKQNIITGLKEEESNPDKALFNMARQTAFGTKPAALNPRGSIKTVTPITHTEAKAYYKSILTRGRMFMVVVADLDKTELEQKLKSLLVKISAGKPFLPKKEAYQPTANSFKAAQKDNATNYIAGITSAPLPGTADYDAFDLAMNVFYNRHFVEIRSKKGLSYAPSTYMVDGTNPFAVLYVTTTEPNKYIAAARALIDTIKIKGFTADELKGTKAYTVSNMYYNQETNSALAGSLVKNEVLHNNWRKAHTAKQDLNKVTVEDLNRVFKKYINNITWVYQGDPKKVVPTMFTQKETPKSPVEKKTF